MDELSPLFHEIEFKERFRGYDVEEVDAYIDRVAKAAALVQGRIAELQNRVAAAESGTRPMPGETESDEIREEDLTRMLLLAQRTADTAIEEATEQAESIIREAKAAAEEARREADEHASLVMAEAETDRRRIVDAADDEARASLQAEKEQVAAEVSELKEYREFLTDDIAILEQHLAESRTALQASVAALSDLVDAPEHFRVPAAPSTSGVDVPEQLVAPQSDVAVVEQDADSDELISDDDLIEFVDQSSGEALIFEPEPLPDSDDGESTRTTEAVVVEAEIEPEFEADEPADYEPDGEDSVLLVDLTEAASVSDPASGQMTAIAPPMLVTAADLETPAGDWIDELSTDSGPATEPVPAVPESLLFEEPSETSQDPFLSQLRDAVQQGEPGEFSDDALTAFFDSDDEEDRRTWFNRRR